jgi:hypothetical protein
MKTLSALCIRGKQKREDVNYSYYSLSILNRNLCIYLALLANLFKPSVARWFVFKPNPQFWYILEAL